MTLNFLFSRCYKIIAIASGKLSYSSLDASALLALFPFASVNVMILAWKYWFQYIIRPREDKIHTITSQSPPEARCCSPPSRLWMASWPSSCLHHLLLSAAAVPTQAPASRAAARSRPSLPSRSEASENFRRGSPIRPCSCFGLESGSCWTYTGL